MISAKLYQNYLRIYVFTYSEIIFVLRKSYDNSEIITELRNSVIPYYKINFSYNYNFNSPQIICISYVGKNFKKLTHDVIVVIIPISTIAQIAV